MSAIHQLGQVSRAYATAAQEYEAIAVAAAEAEATHKAERAKAILAARATAERMSQAEAETRAEADDRIAGLYRDRLVKAAQADAHRARLAQLKEQVAVGRSYVTSERAADQFHADRIGGAA